MYQVHLNNVAASAALNNKAFGAVIGLSFYHIFIILEIIWIIWILWQSHK